MIAAVHCEVQACRYNTHCMHSREHKRMRPIMAAKHLGRDLGRARYKQHSVVLVFDAANTPACGPCLAAQRRQPPATPYAAARSARYQTPGAAASHGSGATRLAPPAVGKHAWCVRTLDYIILSAASCWRLHQECIKQNAGIAIQVSSCIQRTTLL
jgi:hypothetical protein